MCEQRCNHHVTSDSLVINRICNENLTSRFPRGYKLRQKCTSQDSVAKDVHIGHQTYVIDLCSRRTAHIKSLLRPIDVPSGHPLKHVHLGMQSITPPPWQDKSIGDNNKKCYNNLIHIIH